ncbi:MAG: hypothetical protein ACRDLA_03715 [Thermoleophilaceae bacterium]
MSGPSEVLREFLNEHDGPEAAAAAVGLRRDYQTWARSVGAEPLTDDEMREMGRGSGAVLAGHPEWRGEYGWAHEPLLTSSRDYREAHQRQPRARGPSFSDLEAAVGQRADKLLWAWASRAVHLNIDATGTVELPVAPRPSELAEAGERVGSSLAVPTAMLVCTWPTPPDPVAQYGELAQFVLCLGGEARERFAELDPGSG